MKEELKPCPFCGGPADRLHYAGSRYFEVACRDYAGVCLVSLSVAKFTQDDADKAWNTRAMPAATAGEALQMVHEQAEDAGLWFIAQTGPEAYLQQELRKLHEAVERAAALHPATPQEEGNGRRMEIDTEVLPGDEE